MTGTEGIEREAKLALVGEGREELFAALLTRDELVGCATTGFRRLLLADEYYDLPGEPLVARNSALRLRSCDEEGALSTHLTFKGPSGVRAGSVVERVELEAEWSGAFLARILAHIRSIGVEIGESAEIQAADPRSSLAALGLSSIQARRTDRRATNLLRAGQVVAELVLDRVDYGLGDAAVVHREIEIEARGETTLAELEELGALLIAAHPGQLQAWPWSKTTLGRVLEELAAAGSLEPLLEDGSLSPRGYERIAELLPAR